MIKCLECGSRNVHIIAYNTEHVLPSIIEPANQGINKIQNNDLPYILGGNYCCDCQRLVSVFDDADMEDIDVKKEPETMATVKQKKYIKDLLDKWEKNPNYRSEYKDINYDVLTQTFATSIIHDLLNKLKTNAVASEIPKKEIPLATDKQIALIKKKIEESEEIAEKYKNLNFEKLNIYTAKKIIGEILS